ncbi:hybrid sensor histidine kinase/response regulator [Polyangium sp. 6x1]|uniref:hybrid sensor histidine kinase/response regulator n=1 Tax=Polyangium sp. 6x1 TaxID=3042689 RepID=UPI0024824CE7|nr:hybrid sensor histidine kinase/response regulator [Polyangium sp. 6x1]MDI1442973.1 ATP-binding protein [Polyangium sp. 6x1]
MTVRPSSRHRRALSSLGLGLVLSGARPSHAADIATFGAPTIRTISPDEKVPGSVNAIAVAGTGRVWIGTMGGAAYHDGQRFTALPLPTGASSWVQAIAAGEDGSVWLGMVDGTVLRHAEGSFHRFGAAEGLTDARPIRAMVAPRAPGGPAVWVGTLDGLYRFESGRFHRVDLGPGAEHVDVLALREGTLPSGEPTLWAGTWAGLFHCERGRCAPFEADGASTLAKHIGALLQTTGAGGRHELWAATQGEVVRLADGHWESVSPPSSPVQGDPVMALAETVNGAGERTIWAGTSRRGLARFSDGAWTTLTAASSGLPDDYVISLATTGRVLWIGTNTGGLGRLRHDGWTAFTPRNSPLTGTILGLSEVRDAAGKSEIWFGAENRLLRLSDEGFSPVLPPAATDTLGTVITSILPSQREPGVVWIGSDTTRVHRWEAGRLTRYDDHGALHPGHAVYDLRESLDGRALWVGTFSGAARIDEQGAFTLFEKKSSPLVDDQVNAVLETTRPGGGVSTWFATGKGLSRMEKGAWTNHTAASAPLGSDFVMTLGELRDGRGARVLWIGTLGGGVARYDLDAEAWLSRLDTKSRPALPDDNIMQVRADGRGRTYLFTARGIARLSPRAPTPEDPAEFSMYTFTTDDGLPSNDCQQNGSLVDSRGRIWVTTAGGAAVFDPADELEDMTPKPLVLSAGRTSGGALQPGMALAWDENTVSFDYALLSFFRERDTRYRTQMAGFDPSPSDWSTDVKARYTNLSAGAYTFQVWGRDYAGNVAGPVSMAFQVKPAPWRTWWAWLGYALALSGLVWGGVRVRLRALARRNLELERQVEERTAELKSAKEAADRANRAKSSFLASMSHELRTPLNGVLGYTQLVARSSEVSRENVERLGVVQRSGEHLLALIDDLLDLARIEAGKMELAPGDVHLPLLVQGVVDLCRVRAEDKGIAFHYLPAEGAPTWVRADEKRLTQVLLNLLGNAIKFTRTGSVILRVEARGEAFFFHVEDTGPGIAPADVARIFQPFEQSGDRRARAEGAGLGLSISRAIVEQMGGRIEVESVLGEGSTFTVALRLPGVSEQTTAIEERPSEPITGYEGARRVLLVVDDNENNRALLRDTLGPLGFLVEEAENGARALARVEEREPDLVILDLVLPDMHGDEVARRLRRLPALEGMPIVACSASGDEAQRRRAQEAGCDEFLPKPVRFAALFALLARRLGLTWIRAPRAMEEAPRDEAPAPRIEPPPDVVAQLSDLAERGRIPELLEALQALAAEDEQLSAWVSEVRAFAETYRLRELQEKLGPR